MPIDSATFESYRPLLFSIAYRMLGSAMEAEDAVQECYLRLEHVADEAIQSPKAYLTTIVTRLCLDRLKSARMQREQYIGTWLPEPVMTDESPSLLVGDRESISMAFLVLLESLSPVERAVFLLREVFDYPYSEVASIVGKREENCRRYFHRAKQFLVERRPRFEPSTDAQAKLVESFLACIRQGDVDGLTAMLADDVMLDGDGGGKAPAVRQPLLGRDAVTRLLMNVYRMMPADAEIEFAEVNGAPSSLIWVAGVLQLVITVTVVEGRIQSILNILNPDKLAYLQQRGAPTTR